jgi:hypothetical protein
LFFLFYFFWLYSIYALGNLSTSYYHLKPSQRVFMKQQFAIGILLIYV